MAEICTVYFNCDVDYYTVKPVVFACPLFREFSDWLLRENNGSRIYILAAIY